MITNHKEITSPFQRAALDASNVGTWEVDILGDRFRGDAVTASIYGLSVDESIAGVPFARAASRVHPADRPIWRARREHSLRFGGMFVIEYRVLSTLGEIRWVLVRGRYEIAPDGRVTHARGIVIDLTESKRDGFAEGYATFVDSLVEDSDAGALERAAAHALGAHRALSRLKHIVTPSLLIAVDTLLQELGLAIAMTRPSAEPESSRH